MKGKIHMTKLEEKIYTHFQSNQSYHLSDLPEKADELQAINNLEADGLIIVKSRAIGMISAEVI